LSLELFRRDYLILRGCSTLFATVENLRKKLAAAVKYGDPSGVIGRWGLDSGAEFLFERAEDSIKAIESNSAVSSRDSALLELRRLSLDEFGWLLWKLPDERFPKLSRLLPAMAAKEVQIGWTGRCGVSLLAQTAGFVRSVERNYVRLTGASLTGAKILDYGCGYGRVARLMYYHTDEVNLYGVDPWERSISLCKDAGLNENFRVSEYLPSSLPVPNLKFDAIYAYSVFTHLSERATLTALKTLRNYISDSGVLAITFRPIEYWAFAGHVGASDARRLTEAGRSGFAFKPHDHGPATNGEITYGDTSISVDWLSDHCMDWKVRSTDRLLGDRMQTYLYLTPA
jgi:SAM-dependent methyltransferase